MEPIFEVRFHDTKAMHVEYVRQVLFKRQFWTGVAFSAVSLLMFLLTMARGRAVLAAIFGVCALILAAVTLLSPPLIRRQLMDANLRLHNGKTPETVVTFGENISFSEGTVSLTVEYEQIQRVYCLRHCWALMLGKSNGILLNPDSLTQERRTELEAFLREKTGCR